MLIRYALSGLIPPVNVAVDSSEPYWSQPPNSPAEYLSSKCVMGRSDSGACHRTLMLVAEVLATVRPAPKGNGGAARSVLARKAGLDDDAEPQLVTARTVIAYSVLWCR